jgi:hypothetical protein
MQELMAAALYRELEEPALGELNRHLDDCAPCSALYGELRATLETMERRQRPDPGAAFWDGYWQRLEGRVVRDEDEDEGVADASRSGRRWPVGSWGFRAAAAVAILAGGVWIGRTFLAPAGDRPATAPVSAENGAPAQPQEFALDQGAGALVEKAAQPIDAPAGGKRAGRAPGGEAGAGVVTAAGGSGDALRYLGRSQVVLLALLNGSAGDGETGDFKSERAQARVLVAEGRKLQDELTRPEDRRLRDLVGQLEMILREIANLEAGSDLDAVEMIRNRVDREGVLLRIDLQQLREASAPDSSGGKARAFD